MPIQCTATRQLANSGLTLSTYTVDVQNRLDWCRICGIELVQKPRNLLQHSRTIPECFWPWSVAQFILFGRVRPRHTENCTLLESLVARYCIEKLSCTIRIQAEVASDRQ